MSLLKSEPFAAVTSMEELLAIAYVMEQEAIAGYSELAERMRRENRPEMVAVFEQLIGEEKGHLGNVVHWSEAVSGRPPDLARLRWEPADTFDDEGARTVAPELLSAYRAFSIAVRNEERAFVFWTYVAAQTDQERLREAAERMASEELGHLATLRRERRRAFHRERGEHAASWQKLDVVELERRLSAMLEAAAASAGDAQGPVFRELAGRARKRADEVALKPLGKSPLLADGVAPEVAGRPVPLTELLLDCYLDYSERLADENDRLRAQRLAEQTVQCRSALRSLQS